MKGDVISIVACGILICGFSLIKALYGPITFLINLIVDAKANRSARELPAKHRQLCDFLPNCVGFGHTTPGDPPNRMNPIA